MITKKEAEKYQGMMVHIDLNKGNSLKERFIEGLVLDVFDDKLKVLTDTVLAVPFSNIEFITEKHLSGNFLQQNAKKSVEVKRVNGSVSRGIIVGFGIFDNGAIIDIVLEKEAPIAKGETKRLNLLLLEIEEIRVID